MPTPAYGLKHWWRSERRPGESLKAFARRWTSTFGLPGEGPMRFPVCTSTTTCARWLRAKGAPTPAPVAFDSFRDALVWIAIVHNEELRLAGDDGGLN